MRYGVGLLEFSRRIYPAGPCQGLEKGWALRVLRGGSWNNNPNNCRSANRNNNNPDNRNNNIGFRVVSFFSSFNAEDAEARRGRFGMWISWFFSVVDIIQVLIRQPDFQTARKY